MKSLLMKLSSLSYCALMLMLPNSPLSLSLLLAPVVPLCWLLQVFMPEAEHLSRLLAAARRESRQSTDVCHPEHLTDELAHSIYNCCGIHSMCTVGCKQREEAVQDDMMDDEQDSHTAQPQADVHGSFSQ